MRGPAGRAPGGEGYVRAVRGYHGPSGGLGI